MSTPLIQIVVAVNEAGYIGKDGDLMYRCKEDLANFKKVTDGTILIMGRKTFNSLPGVLPGRRHFVVTSDPSNAKYFKSAEAGMVYFFPSFEAALKAARGSIDDKTRGISVVGGESIYEAAIPHATKGVISRIADLEKGDAKFPLFKFIERFEVDPSAPTIATNTNCGKSLIILEYVPIKKVPDLTDCDFIEDDKPEDDFGEWGIAEIDGGRLKFPGGLTLLSSSIVGYTKLRQRNVIDIHTENRSFPVRFKDAEALDKSIKVINSATER